jgi:hypothetical protein
LPGDTTSPWSIILRPRHGGLVRGSCPPELLRRAVGQAAARRSPAATPRSSSAHRFGIPGHAEQRPGGRPEECSASARKPLETDGTRCNSVAKR